jgi:hypothetical protein
MIMAENPRRDAFAAAAMQALLTNLGPYCDDDHKLYLSGYEDMKDLARWRDKAAYDVDRLADYAVNQADALIRAIDRDPDD